MTNIAGRPWDMYRAELADTVRGQHKSRPSLPCVYCGHPTKALSRVCLAHDDLIDLDAGYPAALDEARVPNPRAELAAELAPPTLASSSAALESGRANGDGPPDAAALDSSAREDT